LMYWSGLKTGPAKPGRRKNLKNNMQREEMGIVNGNPMGMGVSMVGEWEWEWLYGKGREWESERHSRTPLIGRCSSKRLLASITLMIEDNMTSFSVILIYFYSLFNPYLFTCYAYYEKSPQTNCKLQCQETTRSLWSTDALRMFVPRTRTETDRRAFSVADP